MADQPRMFIVVTPHLEGEDIKTFQRDLTKRFREWEIDKHVEDDGNYGMSTRQAARQVCHGLGILHEQAMRAGVTPDLRSKIRDPDRRTPAERKRGEQRTDYRAALRKRYKGGGPAQAVEYARSFVGTTETRENRGPQVDKWIRTSGLNPPQPWCGSFVNACIMAAGIDNGKEFGVAAVENIHDRAKGGIDGWKLVNATDGKVGDLACHKGTTAKNPWAHVEIVSKRNSSSSYVCIGGNTGPSSNAVVEHERKTNSTGGPITVFARPPYEH